MQERVKNDNKFAKGAIVLLIGGLVCKFLGAVYRIPLSNILGPEGIGIYQLIFPVFSLFLIFASGGIPISLSKLVAQCRANGETKRAKRFLFQSIILLFVVSVVFSVIFLVFGDALAKFQGNEKAGLGYIGAALAIVFASVLTGFRGYFQGYQNMLPTAFSQIIEQLLKLVLGLSFAFLLIKNGPSYGVLGAMVGIAISELVSLVYLIVVYIVKRKKYVVLEKETKNNFFTDFKILIKQTLPITLNSLILPLILAVDSFLIVNLLKSTGISGPSATQMFGVYSGMVNSLINFPTIVSMALAVSLVPAISYNRENDNSSSINSVFKIVFYISLPCILIYSVFSNEIISILYPTATSGNLLELGSLLLKISSINIFYISLLQISTAILQAKGKSVVALINLTISGVIKIILTLLFVSGQFGIYGAAIASIMCYAIASGLNIIFLKDLIKLKLKIKPILYIFLNSFIIIGISIGLNYLFNLQFSKLTSLIISIIFAGLFYLFLSIIFPIFDEDEINRIPFGKKINILRKKTNKFFKIKKNI